LNNERRQNSRRAILDHFSFYVSIPKLGGTRLKVMDVSEMGIGFHVSTLGEFRLNPDEICELHFYVNQSLFLPLKIQVARQIDENQLQKIGAVFLDTTTPQHQAFLTLVKLLDQLVDVGVIRT
jgi:hypothetical protein